jgi:hypothetical protein
MDIETMEALRQVVDYLWADEKRHYEEDNKPAGHIFETVQKLATYLDAE